jgi:hypothetical protein
MPFPGNSTKTWGRDIGIGLSLFPRGPGPAETIGFAFSHVRRVMLQDKKYQKFSSFIDSGSVIASEAWQSTSFFALFPLGENILWIAEVAMLPRNDGTQTKMIPKHHPPNFCPVA